MQLGVETQVYQIQWNNRFWYQGKLTYDFLLVINTNLPPILHRFQVMADYWSNFRYREGSASL